jgi:hypothetical protein
MSKITLPRAVAEQMRDELYSLVRETDSDCEYLNCKECEPIRPIWDVIVVFDAALAEPEQKPEPATDEQVTEAYISPDIDGRWRDFELGFRAAERFHGIRKEDKT